MPVTMYTTKIWYIGPFLNQISSNMLLFLMILQANDFSAPTPLMTVAVRTTNNFKKSQVNRLHQLKHFNLPS